MAPSGHVCNPAALLVSTALWSTKSIAYADPVRVVCIRGESATRIARRFVILAILLAFALLVSGSQTDTQPRDARAIAVAKNTSVHRLDPSLPGKYLDKWLREVVARRLQSPGK